MAALLGYKRINYVGTRQEAGGRNDQAVLTCHATDRLQHNMPSLGFPELADLSVGATSHTVVHLSFLTASPTY